MRFTGNLEEEGEENLHAFPIRGRRGRAGRGMEGSAGEIEGEGKKIMR